MLEESGDGRGKRSAMTLSATLRPLYTMINETPFSSHFTMNSLRCKQNLTVKPSITIKSRASVLQCCSAALEK